MTVHALPSPLDRAERADRLINQREAGFALGLDEEEFHRRRSALEAQGFPPPVFGSGRKGRWDPAAILAWIDMRRPAAIRAYLASPVPLGAASPDHANDATPAPDLSTTSQEGSPT